ncbi:MAG: DNA alkylation repair protein [Flavobacteriales bacterium]
MNLKEELNKEFISRLADEFFLADKSFQKKAFIVEVLDSDWEVLELKQRMRKITNTLYNYLPFTFEKQVEQILKIAPKFSGIQGFIFPDFVQVYGLDNFEVSIRALELLTQYSTSEFAVRPFIEKYPNQSTKQLLIWSKSNNHHIRRLSSEGSRPKLPWAQLLRNFIKDPNPVLPILENLKNDESLYVRKSVANHLNDISKNHPKLVLDICKKWHGKTKNTDWIVKHALRTLLKAGNKEALAIFGTANAEKIEVEELSLSSSKLKIGEEFTFSFHVQNFNKIEQTLRLEYIIHFIKSNGTLSPKIFKISEAMFSSNTKKQLIRKHKFADLTTRKHYAGKHQLSIVVNGDVKSSVEFDLV